MDVVPLFDDVLDSHDSETDRGQMPSTARRCYMEHAIKVKRERRQSQPDRLALFSLSERSEVSSNRRRSGTDGASDLFVMKSCHGAVAAVRLTDSRHDSMPQSSNCRVSSDSNFAYAIGCRLGHPVLLTGVMLHCVAGVRIRLRLSTSHTKLDLLACTATSASM